ncbi:MAG: 6-phosphogluconolactonase [Gammaproteobacteria bacterium]|jgi:6-phosphogluconolactonase
MGSLAEEIMKNNNHRYEFSNTSQLDTALVQAVAGYLQAAIDEEDCASLVVSGGRTPVAFFQLLSKQLLPWSKVTVTLADERWVDVDHSDSNEKLVRKNLLINQASTAKFVSLKNTAESAVAGEATSSDVMNAMGKFTLVILGMGEDGHTASLFPDADVLVQGLDMQLGRACIAVTPPHAPHPRMSLTLPRLLNTKQLILHITGANKIQLINTALVGDDALELPVRAVLHQQLTPVSIYVAP